MRPTTLLALALLTLATPLAAGIGTSGPAAAEDDPTTGTAYLPLYPPGDLYQLQVVGDGLSYGLSTGLAEALRGDPRVQVRPKVEEFYTLMRGDFADDLESLGETLDKQPPSVAVVIFGPMERISIRLAGKRYWIDSEEWRAEFSRQVDAMMKAFKKRRVAVYWVSFPNVRRPESNEDVQLLNEIVRERALSNGIRYIDAYAGFAAEDGGYSATGPDLAGKIRVLREPNGINFTEAGNRKLAHFVERELKRDLTQAKRDRTIPLVGTEADQAAVAAARQAQQKAAAKPTLAAPVASAAGAGDGTAAGPAGGAGEQKADNGRIQLVLTGANGREEQVAVDLLRPAIPASVVALVSRKEVADKATNLGDLLIDRIPGGLVVMSSISPAAEGGAASRSRLPPTQTPFFRVMVKGERMPVRAERADDLAWPRPEPPPLDPIPTAMPAGPPVAAPPSPGPRGKSAPPGRRADGDTTPRVR